MVVKTILQHINFHFFTCYLSYLYYIDYLKGSKIMDIKKSKITSIILMNMLCEELSNIIDSELDKGDRSDCTMIDQFVELNELLSLSCERLDKNINKH